MEQLLMLKNSMSAHVLNAFFDLIQRAGEGEDRAAPVLFVLGTP